MKGRGLEIRLVAVKDPRFQNLSQEFERDQKTRFGGRNTRCEDSAHLEQACVLFLAGQPIACGGFQQVDDETAELKQVYVRPEQRHKGYASQMIEALELQALFQGYMRMVLASPRKAPERALFSRALGYRERAPWDAFAGGNAYVCMEKELTE